MPRGTAMVILPLGPCTSILPAATAIFTPEGSGIGLFPIRDIVLVQRFVKSCALQTFLKTCLPDFAEQFAAHVGFARGAAAHQALRRGHNAAAQATNDRLNVMRADITARSRPRNALDAGNDAATVRGVLQKN